MPIITGGIMGGLLTAGAAIAGDVMSSNAQDAANQSNLQMDNANIAAAMQRQEEQEAFNSSQAEIARQFSAQSVAQQEQFQRDTIQEAERYNTEMSNTQMQRRVADLRAAGINPLLAISQGGASAPTVSPMPGSVASAAQASGGIASASPPFPMQSTGTAFGNMGAQMSSAVTAGKAGAEIDLLEAQTNKLNAEAGTEIPAQVDYLKSMTGLNTQQAKQVKANIDLIEEQVLKTSSEEILTRNKIVESEMGQRLQQQDLWLKQGTLDALISASNSEATAKALGLAQLRNLNEVQQSQLGEILAYLNAILHTANPLSKLGGN